MEQKHAKYERLLARCRELAPAPTAVAHPCDESSLRGAVEAAEMGLIRPLLVGPRAKILKWRKPPASMSRLTKSSMPSTATPPPTKPCA